MKRLLLLLLLLYPVGLFAQRDTVRSKEIVEYLDGSQEDCPPVLTWKDRREPLLAGFLSYLMPGAGQLYNKQYEKALGIWAFMAGTLALGYQATVVNNDGSGFELFSAGAAAAYLYSILDAITQAKVINHAIDLQLSQEVSLSLKPDIQFNQGPSNFQLNNPKPSFGLKVSLSL